MKGGAETLMQQPWELARARNLCRRSDDRGRSVTSKLDVCHDTYVGIPTQGRSLCSVMRVRQLVQDMAHLLHAVRLGRDLNDCMERHFQPRALGGVAVSQVRVQHAQRGLV